MRHRPIEERKTTLASLLPSAALSVRLCEHVEGDGPIVFKRACQMDLEGIVCSTAGGGGGSEPIARVRALSDHLALRAVATKFSMRASRAPRRRTVR